MKRLRRSSDCIGHSSDFSLAEKSARSARRFRPRAGRCFGARLFQKLHDHGELASAHLRSVWTVERVRRDGDVEPVGRRVFNVGLST